MTNGTKPVRVVAVTQSDPFFTARFFEAFLEGRSSDRLDLVEIVLLRNFNESKPALVRRLFQLRSEEHTSELQSRLHLVCRLLLEKKKKTLNEDVRSHAASTHH